MKAMNDTKSTLNWMSVDMDCLNPAVKAKWAALQKVRAQEKAAREEFESSFLAAARKAEAVEKDLSLAFGYRFGGLAVAKVDKTAERAQSSNKPKFSF